MLTYQLHIIPDLTYIQYIVIYIQPYIHNWTIKGRPVSVVSLVSGPHQPLSIYKVCLILKQYKSMMFASEDKPLDTSDQFLLSTTFFSEVSHHVFSRPQGLLQGWSEQKVPARCWVSLFPVWHWSARSPCHSFISNTGYFYIFLFLIANFFKKDWGKQQQKNIWVLVKHPKTNQK